MLQKGKANRYHINFGKALFLLLQALKGYVRCDYLNMHNTNALRDIVGKATELRTFLDMLNTTVVEISEKVKQKGLKEGLLVGDFFETLL